VQNEHNISIIYIYIKIKQKKNIYWVRTTPLMNERETNHKVIKEFRSSVMCFLSNKYSFLFYRYICQRQILNPTLDECQISSMSMGSAPALQGTTMTSSSKI
jgi:hypothetical protein